MPKFTLTGEHTDLYGNPDGTKVIYEFHVDSLDNVLEHVDLFIRGCGYNPSGTLDYVSDEEYYGLDPDYGDHGGGSTLDDYPELQDDITEWDKVQNKSKYYFDTERNK
jgi:hypothetical protein